MAIPVKLLIVDEDLHFGRILSSVLGNDGHEVVVVTELAQGVAALAQHRPQVLLAAVDATDARSLSFVAQARATPHGAGVGLILLAARLDDTVRRVAERGRAAQTFVRPFSVLDLSTAVRLLALPGALAAPAAPAAASGPLDLDNTTRVLRLWARKANGDLVIGQGPGAVVVTLADGGPLDLGHEAALRAALRGGDLEFRPHDAPGTGDERALAAWIWQEAMAAEAGRSAPPSRATIVAPTRLTESAGRLPLPASLARLLVGLVGPVGLGRLCDTQGVDAQEVAAGLATLASLGVVALQTAPNAETPPAALPPRRPLVSTAVDPLGSGASRTPTLTPHSGADSHSGGSGAADRDDPFATRPASGTTTVSTRAGDPFAARPPSGATSRPAGGDPFARSDGHRLGSGLRPEPPAPPPPAPPPPASPPPAAAPPRPPAAGLPSGVPVRPAGLPMPPGGDTLALIRRLRREVDLLRGSDPWTVLSVPHDADAALVQRAGDRMRARYAELVRTQVGEARDLAEQVLRRVEEARAALEDAGPVAAPDLPGDDAFRAGLSAMAAGDWATADRRFIAARDQNLDSARNLAHVGWARVHNPEYPVADRTAEGLDLLLLAEQLDPLYADGQYFLAMVLHRRGDDDAARRRIARALRAEPSHVAANALARKLRRPASP